MVGHCCAYNCSETSVKGGPITFHCFPRDKLRRKLWECKVRRQNFTASNYTKICSKHFTEDCFDREKFGGTWLKDTAVPTIFDFPDDLKEEKIVKRKRNHDDSCLEDGMSFSNDSVSSSSSDSVVPINNDVILPSSSDSVTPIIDVMSPSSSDSIAPINNDVISPSSRVSVTPIIEIISPSSRDSVAPINNNAISPSSSDSVHPSCNGPIKRKRHYYFGDYSEEDMASPSIARDAFVTAQDLIEKQKNVIRDLRRTTHFLVNRVAYFEEILEEIKECVHLCSSTKDISKLTQICSILDGCDRRKTIMPNKPSEAV